MTKEFWPGTRIEKSTNNAFTLGWKGTPHGYVPGQPPKVAPIRPVKPKTGGFAKNSGTLHGLSKRPNAPTIYVHKRA